MLKEFQEFALKGNVVDLAIGVIIGGAFGTIVSSLVGDMIMALNGAVGSVDFSNYFRAWTRPFRRPCSKKPRSKAPSWRGASL